MGDVNQDQFESVAIDAAGAEPAVAPEDRSEANATMPIGVVL